MRLFSEDFPEIRTQQEFDAFAKTMPKFDTGYLFQSSVLERRKTKEWMERLWQQYRPYADSNFHKEFKIRFNQRSWELYLGATFFNRGFGLGSRSDSHPDLDVRFADRDECAAWVEAIAVTKGTGEDRVPDMQYGVASIGLPDDEMSLRLTQALKDKHDQYQQRVQRGVVADSEPYVIAIDRSELGFPEFTPLVLRVAYGIGHLTLTIPVPAPGQPIAKPEEHESFYQRQEVIAKKNGEAISSTFFLDPAHSGISAIIYSTHGIINLPRKPEQMGENFLIAHNPHAKNPIVGLFPFGEEYTGSNAGAKLVRGRSEYERPDAFEYFAH
jgi:hypothetical protein